MARSPNVGGEPKGSKRYNMSNDAPEKVKFKNVAANHPFNNDKNNKTLVDYCRERLDMAATERDARVQRYEYIDREIAGYLELTRDDKKRERDNRAGRGMKVTDVKLQLIHAQVDEAVTYLMSVFAPDSGIFEAMTSADKQQIANSFAAKLNRDGDILGYYTQLSMGMNNMLKYNLGGWLTEWIDIWGQKVEEGVSGKAVVNKHRIIWSGNQIEAIDPYNFLYDISVHPTQVNYKGEFFAIVEKHREFRVQMMENNKEVFGANMIGTEPAVAYYKPKPAIRMDIGSDGSVDTIDWHAYLSAGNRNEVSRGIELVHIYIWLCPSTFKLSTSTDMEIWRITIANGIRVIAAKHLDDAHGMLPLGIGSPMQDNMGSMQKTFAEILIPLQRFASFLMNVHQRATRKALYGVKLVDPSIVPTKDMSDEDLESGKIEAKPAGYGKDMRQAIHAMHDAPETSQTLVDMGRVMELMQRLLPTDMLKQVADLQRATTYQAAATVQGGNRRNLKIAKTIEDQAMKPVRRICLYNVLQKQEAMKFMDPRSGQEVDIKPSEFRSIEIEFKIAEGLKGIDRLMLIELYREVIMAIMQNAQAIQQFDVPGLLNYWSSLMGDETDLSRFKIVNPLMQLDPQIQQMIMTFLQQGGLQTIVEATKGSLPPQPGQQQAPAQQ